MTEFVVIGATGTGKSSFCNFVLNKEIFQTSDDPNSETKEVKGSFGIKDAKNIFAIDTPGLKDSSDEDQIHIKNISQYLRKRKKVQAIILAINFHCPRFDSTLRELLLVFGNMFPIEDFWEHVGIVFTKYFIKKKQDALKIKKEKSEGIKEKMKALIDQIHNKNKNIKSPNNYHCFFVDCDLTEIDKESKEEVNRMIGWMHNLEPLDTIKVREVDNKIMERIKEKKNEIISSYFDKNIEYITMGTYQRFKEIRYNGKVTYSDYKLIKKEIIKKVHPVKLSSQKEETRERDFYSHRKNDYEYRKKYIEKRLIKVYNDGTLKYTEWKKEPYSESTYEIYHSPQFLKIEKSLTHSNSTYKGNIEYYKENLHQRNIFKRYDGTLIYDNWKLVYSVEKRIVHPKSLISTTIEKKVEKEEVKIVTYKEKRVLKFLIIFIPIFKTVQEEIVTYKNKYHHYWRKVFYYNDNSIEYGSWNYDYTS